VIGVRPTPTARYVPRPRLLERLPDAPGYVVWLEAPYGYGKSVLTMQWAERLEADGWRVVWLSLAGREALPVLASAVELPASSSWGDILDALWSVPTSVVLEDLDGSESLEPLLKHVAGLVTLSSRRPLSFAALPPLLTAGRLVHLRASELAFTEDEAATLLPDREAALRLWRETAGWSLPLHFASLTGTAPDRAALLEGIRSSVGQATWREALLIATLDVLPSHAASDATVELASAGFVQALDAGYRLHPLAAEALLERHGDEAREAVAALAGRLPGPLRGRAFARVGLDGALRALLEDEHDDTHRTDPREYLRWHGLVDAPAGPVRRCHAAVARMSHPLFQASRGDVTTGIRDADALAHDATQPPRWRARAALAALFTLAEVGRLDETGPFQEVAEALAPDLPPFEASRVARTLVTIDYHRGDHEAMERHVADARSALARAEDDARQPEAVAILEESVAKIRFELYGAVEPARRALDDVLSAAASPGAPRPGEPGAISHVALARSATLLAAFHRLAGEGDRARAVIDRWSPIAAPPFQQFMELQRADLDGDLEVFPGLYDEFERLGVGPLAETAAASWLRCLRRHDDATAAERLRERFRDVTPCRLEFAILDARHGRMAEAEAAVVACEHADASRSHRVLWLEAAFLVRRDPRHLDELCSQLDVGAAVLRHLDVPLDLLPRDRPELARAYPLTDVMASDWTEAIALRECEVPPLELRVLGGVSARSLEGDLDLSERQQQLLVLLALGATRESIGAAMWPEADTAKVRNNLNVLLNAVRRVVQPWGLPTHLHEGGLRHVTSDLERLEAALQAGDWDAVASTYTGRLGAGVDIDVVSQAADVLERRVLEGLREAASDAAPERAIALLDRLIELDPLHEEALHDLVVLLLRSGRRREARRRYRALADRLHADLGVAPSEATTRLIDQA